MDYSKNLTRLLVAFTMTVLCLAQSGKKSGIDPSSLDTTCKPCDDFFRYANGSWLDRNPIPADRYYWSPQSVLQNDNDQHLKTILDAAAANKQAGGDERRLGDFYASCMDTSAIEAAGIRPLEPELRRIAAIRTRRDLAAVLVTFDPEGRLGPSRIGTFSDPADADQTYPRIVATQVSLPERGYYFRQDEASRTARNQFVQRVLQTFQLLGDAPDSAAREAKTVLDFETVFAQASLTNAERREPGKQNQKLYLRELQELAPEYDWKSALKLLRISDSIAIFVQQPEFLKAVNRQLQEAPLQTWKTWLRWRLANARSPQLPKAFQRQRWGETQEPPRWKVCVEVIDSVFAMGDALGRLYVQKYFPPEAKRRTKEIVQNLRGALEEQLREADWLEPETRQNALRKLSALDSTIGYPSTWTDYARLNIHRGKYLENGVSASIEHLRVNRAEIGKKVDDRQGLGGLTTATVSARYAERLNAIFIPAGILQPPFFTLDGDDAANYGAIGAIIGHEMGHAFDDLGSKYDFAGNLKNWWTDSDLEKFQTRAACVTDQFDSLDAGNGRHHNGKLVTGEAMADLSGAISAYRAYHRSLNGKEAPVLDGFSGDQRFFLAFARRFAGSQRPESEQVQLNRDPHPLVKFRLNATLQNMAEFHQAFACRRGDPMVRPPEKQCRLW